MTNPHTGPGAARTSDTVAPSPADPPVALAHTLHWLHANGHPLGLPPDRADALARALSSGTPAAEAAARAGLPPRVVDVLATARPADGVATLRALVTHEALAGSHARTLRTAATYPLALLVAITACGGVVFTLALPALRLHPTGGEAVSVALPVAAMVVAATLIVVLSAAVWTRAPVPWLDRGWRRLDGFRFLAALPVLVDAGVPLPRAVRASAAGLPPRHVRVAESLARHLEAGLPEPADPPDSPGDTAFLDALERQFLLTSAGTGTLPLTLVALADLRRTSLHREVTLEAARLNLVGVVLAGVALGSVAVSWFLAYLQALVG